MEHITFLINVFCLVDDFLKGKVVRHRGPKPLLQDCEVLTMEIVGEFLGIDTHSGIFHYFSRHYSGWFPTLRHIYRTTFVRQSANLWRVKQQLWAVLLEQVNHDRLISVTDSLPIPMCRFAREYRRRLLTGQTAFGKDHVARQTFLGVRVHLRISLPGVIADFRLAPANVQDLEVAEDLFEGVQGWVLGDSNYWSPTMQVTGQQQGLFWLTPLRNLSQKYIPGLAG